MTCPVVIAEGSTAALSTFNQIEAFDLPVSPYCAVTTRIHGNAALTINGKTVHDRDYLQVFEEEEFIVSVQPEYGFHLISLEFEGEALVPISSTAYKGDIQKDGTLRAVLTRWNANIPVTFSIMSPYQVKVYGAEIQDQQTIYCYPNEVLELVIDTPPNSPINGNINGRRLTQIDAHTYTVSVAEPGTLHIGEYNPAEEEKSPFKRFIRPNHAFTPRF
jgi:hypothetical protein